MKKIIVTGCNGQLGRAINQVYAGKSDYELVNTDVIEGDGITSLNITDVDQVLDFARQVKPYAIINCAAHTNVDKCETDVDNAYRINAIGPRNLSIAATETGAKLIHVSTDYVFEGNDPNPRTEFDKVNPISMYGRTKLAGEEFVKQFAKDYFIIRTAWLYGDGKNFARTMLRLSEDHDEIKVVNDQIGSPTSASELAKAIAYLEPTENYGLFHGTCEGICSWADFAAEVLRLAGKSTVICGISTEEYNSPTQRPAYSVLENYMLKLTTDFMFADWHDAIAEYMR
ncbi:MAG: dTDP-4-dehydrorhamnose reductase [Lachnospiraceae bacterium]|jgi:dTDP-4-dehydrorhamnose reductase|nr:dTDP-4-dehydrorhamnose reductase [Lachnospiraceae bacterium]